MNPETGCARIDIRGGAQLDLSLWTWPFARLTVTREEVAIGVPGLAPIKFTKEDRIVVCEVSGIPFFSTGVLVRHDRPNSPKRIRFGTLSWSSAWLLDAFDERGWRVERRGHTSDGPQRS